MRCRPSAVHPQLCAQIQISWLQAATLASTQAHSLVPVTPSSDVQDTFTAAMVALAAAGMVTTARAAPDCLETATLTGARGVAVAAADATEAAEYPPAACR